MGSRAPQQGMLQVKAGGRWSTSVCHNKNDELAPIADVVCKELGLDGGWPDFSLAGSDVDRSSVLTGTFACTGNETALARCSNETEFTFGQVDYGCDSFESENAFYVYIHCASVLHTGGGEVSACMSGWAGLRCSARQRRAGSRGSAKVLELLEQRRQAPTRALCLPPPRPAEHNGRAAARPRPPTQARARWRCS